MPDNKETGNTEAGSTESAVLREVTGPVAVLTLNRPKARNALDDATRETLRAELEALNANPDVRVIILTGAGSAFCAGGDIKGMQQRLEQPPGQVAINGWRRQHRTGAFVTTLANCEQITIAAVNGPAMGLGMDIALACDFIVAAPEAQFAASFVKRGLIPDGGGLYTLPRRIGLQPQTLDNQQVPFSQTLVLDFHLSTQVATLAAVEVTGVNAGEFSPTHTGTRTTISDSVLLRVPTTSRNVTAP